MRSAGQLITLAGTFEIGQELFDEVNQRAQEKVKIKEEKDKKDMEAHQFNIEQLKKLRKTKDEAKWTMDDLRLGLQTIKKKEIEQTPVTRLA